MVEEHRTAPFTTTTLLLRVLHHLFLEGPRNGRITAISRRWRGAPDQGAIKSTAIESAFGQMSGMLFALTKSKQFNY